MKIGISLPERGEMSQPEQLTALAQHAEELGFYAVEFGDHIIIPERIRSRYPYNEKGEAPEWEDWVEQLTALSFLAGKTKTIRLITSVMVVPYRHPLLASKVLASLDVLSMGRLIVGVGAGWMREEFEALRLPSFGERGSVTDEYLEIFKEVWTGNRPTYRGKYFSFPPLKFSPKPVQKPHPPIWVGGESEAALRRAARLGDAWYPLGTNPEHRLRTLEQLKSSIDRLHEYVRTAMREPSEIQVCLVAPQFRIDGKASGELFVGDAEKIASDINSCEKLGVTYLGFDFAGRDLSETISKMNEFSVSILTKLD